MAGLLGMAGLAGLVRRAGLPGVKARWQAFQACQAGSARACQPFCMGTSSFELRKALAIEQQGFKPPRSKLEVRKEVVRIQNTPRIGKVKLSKPQILDDFFNSPKTLAVLAVLAV